ncbi:MAG: threonine--tRNA ligase [Clostridiales bacterium]|jgi:threonyl-tRNA synthetase|nr:threonine--tRNA ligase [Clostridiales bacterium]
MDNIYLDTVRHSLAHVLAWAVCDVFSDVRLGIGPPVDNGFYYDFDLPHTITEADFAAIEARMNEIIRGDFQFIVKKITNYEEFFANQPYKLELIEELRAEGEEITAYELGDFVDLCAGPHVESTRELRNWGFKIGSIAGAYWRGDSGRQMLQRVYVHAFPSRKELKQYYQFLEEAKKRDHRVLGPALDLFFFDETAPGMPYWLPKGLKIYNLLLNFSRKVHEARGYHEMAGPQLNSGTLWETSGHWEHYRENMYIFEQENYALALKPMNCPNAIKAYARKNRSYRDLPLRFMDTSVLHRKEASGTFHGLLRVQSFRQDDSHNFITFEQISEEINEILDITDYLYGVFGLSSRAVLSTRPEEGFLGDIADWDKAEGELKQVLQARYGDDNFSVDEGGGAFYGPKIDIKVHDSLKREWQLATIQLDFQLAGKFGAEYTDSDGKRKTPVLIHRALFGSLERFIGVLIEHFAAKFPFWLSANQIGIVPVHKEHEAYAAGIKARLDAEGFRVNIDTSDGTMGNKIKSYRNELTPYIIILGDKEAAEGTISLRTRSGTQINNIPLESFIAACRGMEGEYSLELVEEL